MTTILGLTGSIGMGKTTIGKQFAALGAQVSDADAIVHQLLSEDEALIDQIESAFPGSVVQGAIDRKALGQQVFTDEIKLKQLESLLHPKVRAEHLRRIEQAKAEGVPVLVLEIPLLYETGAEQICDAVVVITCDAEIQRQRVLAREGMTEEKFQQILSRQLPDVQKRARADYIIDTSDGLEASQAQVEALMAKL